MAIKRLNTRHTFWPITQTFGIPARYGTGIDWNEFHTRVEWQSND